MPSQAAACLLLNNPVLSCRVDAGKVELDGAQYLGFRIPLTISQLVWIEVILVGGAEVFRNRERDPETRLYPGKLPRPTQVMNDVTSSNTVFMIVWHAVLMVAEGS